MRFIKSLQNKVTTFVQKRGSILPKLFVWLYASIFIGCGLVTIVGILYEFTTKGAVNYVAVNSFVKEYFAPIVVSCLKSCVGGQTGMTDAMLNGW